MAGQTSIPEITVVSLKQRLDTASPPLILDVREDHELSIASLPVGEWCIHIPLGQLPQRLDELWNFKEKEIVVYCHSGGRSLMATHYLRQHGFEHAFNLKGGIQAWSKEIDPNTPEY